MLTNVLIKATTEAATSPSFSLETGYGLVTSSLIGSESITVQVYDWSKGAKGEFVNYMAGGSTVMLDKGTNACDIYKSWLTYRVVKSATVNPVGVGISPALKINNRLQGNNNAN